LPDEQARATLTQPTVPKDVVWVVLSVKGCQFSQVEQFSNGLCLNFVLPIFPSVATYVQREQFLTIVESNRVWEDEINGFWYKVISRPAE